VKEECALGKVYTDLQAALAEGFDAVLVCTPPSTHMPIARECIERGAHLFIEKPLSNTLEGVDDLIRAASAKKRVLSVGYNFRFDSGLRTIKESIAKKDLGAVLAARAQFGQYLPDWRPWQDYMQSYTARQDLGGGIILDGSHELDYLRWLIGDVREVSCFAGRAANLKADTEGIAEILLKFESGCLGEVHLDFVRPGYTRDCEIIGETGVVRWDYKSRTVSRYEPGAKEWQSLKVAGDNEDMYVAEMRNFIASIQGLEEPLVTGPEGMKSLKVALAAKESAATGRVVRL
jgi:predicted dehydrogenase